MHTPSFRSRSKGSLVQYSHVLPSAVRVGGQYYSPAVKRSKYKFSGGLYKSWSGSTLRHSFKQTSTGFTCSIQPGNLLSPSPSSECKQDTLCVNMTLRTVTIVVLKALCHDIRCNCFLISSLVQKLNQSGYRKYGYTQYHGIVHGDRTCAAQRLSRWSS